MASSIINTAENRATSGAIDISAYGEGIEAYFAVASDPSWISITSDTARLGSKQFNVSGYLPIILASYKDIENINFNKQLAFFEKLTEHTWYPKNSWTSTDSTNWTPISLNSPSSDVFAQRFSGSLTKLLAMLELAANWDSYGSAPPSKITVAHSIQLLANLFKHFQSMNENLPEPFVAPVPDGRIQFEWESNKNEIEVCIDDDGNMEYLFFPGNATDYVEGSVATFSELGEMLLGKLFRRGTQK